MKKLFGILLCLVLIAAATAPTCAFAQTQTEKAAASEVVHFINPTAMTILDDRLYVADIVEDHKTALLCFEIGGSAPLYKGAVELDGERYNLSNNGTDRIYAVGENDVVELKLVGEERPQYETQYKFEERVIAFTYGKLSENKYTQYALTTQLLKNVDGQFRNILGTTPLTSPKDCLTLGNYVYYLYGENEAIDCKCYDGYGGFYPNDGFNANFKMSGFTANGLFVWENSLAMFSKNSIRYVDAGAETYSLVTLKDMPEDYAILDVQSSANKLYVLNNKNKIEVYQKAESNFELSATIGSDVVELPIPTDYTKFTLAKSVGYPTNIVYKTIDEQTSIDEINPETREYLILGFEGDTDYRYYYVMVGDKFGWVKKSDYSNSPENDPKLEIVDTSVNTGGIGYNAKIKFNSLNAVYVYKLPRGDAAFETLNQSASNMKEVKLLQKFTEKTDDGNKIWYLVQFDDNKQGFVENTSVGSFHSVQTEPLQNVVGDKKINSTLFEAVKMYLSPELEESELVHDKDGNLIKLYSGDRVTVVLEQDGKSYIQVRKTDGTCSFGWVESNRLIGLHAITSNAIVGLSLLAVAIALSSLLLIVFFKRKKRIKANKD